MTMASEAAVGSANKRREPRKPFLWKCSIPVLGTQHKGLLMNLSLSGAKIRMKGPFAKGFRGEIDVPKLDLTFNFEVVWNNGDTVGIQFEESPSMTAPQFRGLFMAN